MTIQDRLYQNKLDIIQRVQMGESTNSIAKDYGCSSGSIWLALRDWQIEPANKRAGVYGQKDEYKDQIVTLFQNGQSAYKIGKQLGISKYTILKWLKSWGFDTSKKRKDDPDNRLKDKTAQVLELHNQGRSQNEIAEIVNHSTSSICKLLQHEEAEPRDWKYHVKEDFFSAIDTEEKAYILGWWYSDGNVMDSGKCRLQIAEQDKDILDWIRAQLEYEGPLHFVKRRQQHHQDQWCLDIGRVKMKDDLIKLGCIPNKSLNLHFPTSDQVPAHLLNHFVRGYFDGDGSCSNGIMIVGSKQFCNCLAKAIPCAITNIYQRYKDKKPEKSAHQLFIGRKKERAKFTDWLYQNATIWLDRKKQALLPSFPHHRV